MQLKSEKWTEKLSMINLEEELKQTCQCPLRPHCYSTYTGVVSISDLKYCQAVNDKDCYKQ